MIRKPKGEVRGPMPEGRAQFLWTGDALRRHTESLSHLDKVRVDVLHIAGEVILRLLCNGTAHQM
jgi:hypothetical protein